MLELYLILISLFLSSIGLTVDAYGGLDEMSDLVGALEKYGINFIEYPKVRDLKYLGDWVTTNIFLNTDDFNENQLVDFVNAGNSVVVILNEDTENLISFVEELSINVSLKFNKEDEYDYVSPIEDTNITGISTDGYSFNVVEKAHAEYYTVFHHEKKDSPVIAIQGKNDARVVVFGSSKLVSDPEGGKHKNLKDLNVVVDLILWAFKQKGLLRYQNLTYVRHADGSVNPPELAIGDNISFSIYLESFDIADKYWKPYLADDVQLQFSMLVPRIRKTLVSQKNGTYSLTFKCPDIFGLYQFIVDYHGVGYTPINATHPLMLRPLRHNEFERYVSSAYPFYFVTFLMLIGVVFVIVVFALHAPRFSEKAKNLDQESKKESQKKSQKEHSKEKPKADTQKEKKKSSTSQPPTTRSSDVSAKPGIKKGKSIEVNKRTVDIDKKKPGDKK